MSFKVILLAALTFLLLSVSATTTWFFATQRGIETQNPQSTISATALEDDGTSETPQSSPSTMRKVLATLLVVFIVGGFFSEMQTPGVGISFAVSIVASILFFTLFYIDGYVEFLDILLFLIGLILILLEIFVIPGFGLTGILGLLFAVSGLSLALVDNSLISSLDSNAIHDMLVAAALVIIGLTIGIFGSMALSHFLTTSKRTPAMALHKEMTAEEGYIGVQPLSPELVGREGIAETVLRPSGKVVIDGMSYDAVALGAMVAKGARIVVAKIESSQLYVKAV